MRHEFMRNGDVRDQILDMIDELCENIVLTVPRKGLSEEWDMVSSKPDF